MVELQWSDALCPNLLPMDERHGEFVALPGVVAKASDAGLRDAWTALIDHTDR